MNPPADLALFFKVLHILAFFIFKETEASKIEDHSLIKLSTKSYWLIGVKLFFQ